MSEGERELSGVKQILRLFAGGSIPSEVPRSPSLSGAEPSAPDTEPEAADYVRMSGSGQEAQRVNFANSLETGSRA